jgi:hypothetical protein
MLQQLGGARLNENKENQQSPCYATCMKTVALMHWKCHYADNTADTGYNNNNNNIYLTAIELSPGGSGYLTCIQI